LTLLGWCAAYSELHYRCFGKKKTYRPRIQGLISPRRIPLTLNTKPGSIVRPETSVSNYQSTLRKLPKQRWSHEMSVCRNHKLNRSSGYIRLRSENCGKQKKRYIYSVCLISRFCASLKTWTFDIYVLYVSKPITSPWLFKVVRWSLAFGKLQEGLLVFHHIFFSYLHLCPEDGGKLFFRNVDTTYYTTRCFKPRIHKKIFNMKKSFKSEE